MQKKNLECAGPTWIEGWFGYPKFEPCDERHANEDPNKNERIRKPLPPGVRLKRPVGVHAPEGDERRKAEAHDAVYIRLQHPTDCLRRVIIYGTIWRQVRQDGETFQGQGKTYTVATMWPAAEGYFSPGPSSVRSTTSRERGA